MCYRYALNQHQTYKQQIHGSLEETISYHKEKRWMEMKDTSHHIHKHQSITSFSSTFSEFFTFKSHVPHTCSLCCFSFRNFWIHLTHTHQNLQHILTLLLSKYLGKYEKQVPSSAIILHWCSHFLVLQNKVHFAGHFVRYTLSLWHMISQYKNGKLCKIKLW